MAHICHLTGLSASEYASLHPDTVAAFAAYHEARSAHERAQADAAAEIRQ